MNRFRIACDSAELAVDCAEGASAIGLTVEPFVSSNPQSEVASALERGERAALLVEKPPSPEDLVVLARATGRVALGLVAAEGDSIATLELAADLGIPSVDEVRPLLATLALLAADEREPWLASTRKLPEVDRARLGLRQTRSEGGKGTAKLVRADGGQLALEGGKARVVLGEPRDVAAALRALRAAQPAPRGTSPSVDAAARRTVDEIVFGPPRGLSDPASKQALAPYGIPVPDEELCASPSRAAAEAARIGFPVRIALASPELRVRDHPDLAVDGVDNSARVREVFRQIMALAHGRARDARLLGVTVSATRAAAAFLRVSARALPDQLVLAELGFADPHGVASGDHTHTILPIGAVRAERVLGRLAGSELVLEGPPARRAASVHAIADVLDRLAAFVVDRKQDVELVEIDPLVVLVGGGLEVREACVKVTDFFERRLESSG